MSSGASGQQGPLTPLETIVLEDPAARARVVVAPSRGGMVTRFEAFGTPVLFLDVATLVDESKNVRGGNPVLFPSPGPLAGDRFTRGGRSGSMKQHGFARQRAWSVVEQGPSDVTLELASDDATRAQYPWDFRARLRYALAGTTLGIETRIESTAKGDDEPMPFSLGFHPYFYVPDADKARARIATDATRAYDNVTKTVIDVKTPIDLTVKELDLHLFDHHGNSATLDRGVDRIVVSGDPELGRWVIWTLAGKDFVCLEPWTSGADALNTGEGLLTLRPGETRTLTVKMRVERA
jgi:galactose mutarotase-like enzyme